METINLLDVVLVLLVVLGAWSGWRRGFLSASVELLALAASVVIAFIGYPYPAALLEEFLPWLGVWNLPLSFVATFVALHLVLGTAGQRAVAALGRRTHAHRSNRVLGIVPGLVNGVINATLVALIVLTIPLFERLSTLAQESALANRLATPARWVEAMLMPIFDPAIRRTLQTITVPPESPTTIALHFKFTAAKPRPDLEERMLEMVNAERARHSLKPLKADPELTEVARTHSRDMFARGYFSHVSADGRKLADRMRQSEVRYLVAGENLALAQSLAIAHQGLMNSPGHRANILRPQFGRLGIGVLDGGMYGLMITQNFRN
jgi:uncharacterized protein YkwD